MRHIHLAIASLPASFVIAVVLLGLGLAAPAAHAQVCGVATPITIANGGFEDPTVAPNTDMRVTTLPGWGVAGEVTLSGPSTIFTSGSQSVLLGDGITSGGVAQALDGTALAGSTVTFTIISIGSGTIALGDPSQAVSGSMTATFDVPAAYPANLTLILIGNLWRVDSISGTYTVSCPEPEPEPALNPACADAANGTGPFAGARVIYAQPGVPTFGGTGSQVIIGTSGPDVIDGATGNDLICGGGGHDTLTGGSGNDVVYGDEGNDQLLGQSGGDRLDGGIGSDACDGGTGSNQVFNCER